MNTTDTCNSDQTTSKKPTLPERALLTQRQSLELESIFKLLANGTRLRILHALARGQRLCVNELSGQLDMKPQAVSNQLQLLSSRGVVEAERSGIQMFYTIVDPCVVILLERSWCLVEDASERLDVNNKLDGKAS